MVVGSPAKISQTCRCWLSPYNFDIHTKPVIKPGSAENRTPSEKAWGFSVESDMNMQNIGSAIQGFFRTAREFLSNIHGERLRADPIIWVSVFFFSIVSFLTTYLSFRETIFDVSKMVEVEGFWPNTLIFVKHSFLPFTFALALAGLILGLKIKLVGSTVRGSGWVAAIISLVLAAMVSIVFNYDIVFRTAREPFLVQQQQAEAYNVYGNYLKDARDVLGGKTAAIEAALTKEKKSLEDAADAKLGKQRAGLKTQIDEIREAARKAVEVLEKDRNDKIAATEKDRDEKVPALEKALGTRQLEIAKELGALRAQLESEKRGLVGGNLTGQAGYGVEAKRIDARLTEGQEVYKAELVGKQKLLETERGLYASRLTELRSDYEKRIAEARGKAETEIKEASKVATGVTDAEKTAINTKKAADIKLLEEDADQEKAKVRAGLKLVGDVDKALEELGKCDTVTCVSDRDNKLASMLLPVSPIVGKPLPRTAALPAMFASIELTVDVLRGMFGGTVPREATMVIFAWFVALLIDLADIFAMLLAKRAVDNGSDGKKPPVGPQQPTS